MRGHGSGGRGRHLFRRYWDEDSRIRPGLELHYQQPIITLPDLDNMQVR
jgi:hypothetical protein